MPVKRKDRTWRVVILVPAKGNLPALRTCSEREEGGICPGCNVLKKHLRSYTINDGEPNTCSMNCRRRVLEMMAGGVRIPTPHQLRVTRLEKEARERALTQGLITGLEEDPKASQPLLHIVVKNAG